ncbi:MAG: alternative ribosome rescue aminoacyl-tRNA hydrolase ArfB [Chloroflexota bacterium]
MSDIDSIQINDKIKIPRSELEFRVAHAGGPGGQHVNKTETKVILRFDIQNSPSLKHGLSEADRLRLIQKLDNRIDSSGILQVTSQDTRSQHKNREIALDKFQFLIQEGLKKPKPRKKTRPSRKAQQRRLDHKKKQAKKKQNRNWKYQE